MDKTIIVRVVLALGTAVVIFMLNCTTYEYALADRIEAMGSPAWVEKVVSAAFILGPSIGVALVLRGLGRSSVLTRVHETLNSRAASVALWTTLVLVFASPWIFSGFYVPPLTPTLLGNLPTEIVSYYSEARQGSVAAAAIVGESLCGNDHEKIGYWYLKAAADRGSADAAFQLGELYSNGAGVEKDDSKALEWRLRALRSGHPQVLEAIRSSEDYAVRVSAYEVWRKANAGLHTLGITLRKSKSTPNPEMTEATPRQYSAIPAITPDRRKLEEEHPTMTKKNNYGMGNYGRIVERADGTSYVEVIENRNEKEVRKDTRRSTPAVQ